MIELLSKRRTYYNLGKEIPVEENKIFDFIKKATELVPDAFNMKSSRVVVVAGEKQNELWERIYDEFSGKVSRDKIESFKNAYGTILYFYDSQVVKGLQEKFPAYAENFPNWATQSSAMLQISIWSGLREMNIGANIQHYNPVIDEMVKKLYNLPESYVLIAEMPFGEIISEPEPKEKEDINKRVKIIL